MDKVEGLRACLIINMAPVPASEFRNNRRGKKEVVFGVFAKKAVWRCWLTRALPRALGLRPAPYGAFLMSAPQRTLVSRTDRSGIPLPRSRPDGFPSL